MKTRLPENQIVCCDCLEGMALLPDECIPFTLTSPPYDDLRTYDGNNDWNFMAVARELYRITMQGGVVARVWVVQEQIVDGSESGETSRQRLAFAEMGFRLHHTMVMGKTGGHQSSPRPSLRSCLGICLHPQQRKAPILPIR